MSGSQQGRAVQGSPAPGPTGAGTWADEQILRGDGVAGIQGGRATENDTGRVTLDNNNGTAEPELQLGRVAPKDTWIRLAPIELDPANYPNAGITNWGVLQNGINNQVTLWGHNVGRGPGPENAALRSAWWACEYRFNTTGAGPIYSEWHAQWFGPLSTPSLRPFTAIVNWTTLLAQWGTAGAGVMLSSAGAQIGALTEGGRFRSYTAAGGFSKIDNNTPLLLAANNVGSEVELMRLSTTNNVILSLGPTATSIWELRCTGGFYLGTPGAIEASAVLQTSPFVTDKGWLPPRLTTAQRVAVAAPAAGLEMFDTDLQRPHVRTTGGGGQWEELGTVQFGELRCVAGAAPQVLAVGYALINQWTAIGLSKLVTGVLAATYSLAPTIGGTYRVVVTMTIQDGATPNAVDFAVFVNGVQTTVQCSATDITGGLPHVVAMQGFVTVGAGQLVDVRMRSLLSAGSAALVQDGQFTLQRV